MFRIALDDIESNKEIFLKFLSNAEYDLARYYIESAIIYTQSIDKFKLMRTFFKDLYTGLHNLYYLRDMSSYRTELSNIISYLNNCEYQSNKQISNTDVRNLKCILNIRELYIGDNFTLLAGLYFEFCNMLSKSIYIYMQPKQLTLDDQLYYLYDFGKLHNYLNNTSWCDYVNLYHCAIMQACANKSTNDIIACAYFMLSIINIANCFYKPLEYVYRLSLEQSFVCERLIKSNIQSYFKYNDSFSDIVQTAFKQVRVSRISFLYQINRTDLSGDRFNYDLLVNSYAICFNNFLLYQENLFKNSNCTDQLNLIKRVSELFGSDLAFISSNTKDKKFLFNNLSTYKNSRVINIEFQFS